MTAPATAAALRSLSDRLAAEPGLAAGLLRPVDYSRRTRYRRPPGMYLRLQWIGPLATAAGIVPDYVITLEVPGRHSGVIRRTTLARADCDGGSYLVSLAGESEWVRNVRAVGGRVVIGRRQRRTARLVEVPQDQRAPVIRAYLLRAGLAPWFQSRGQRGPVLLRREPRPIPGGAQPDRPVLPCVPDRGRRSPVGCRALRTVTLWPR